MGEGKEETHVRGMKACWTLYQKTQTADGALSLSAWPYITESRRTMYQKGKTEKEQKERVEISVVYQGTKKKRDFFFCSE